MATETTQSNRATARDRERHERQVLRVVTSAKMEKTIVVEVTATGAASEVPPRRAASPRNFMRTTKSAKPSRATP